MKFGGLPDSDFSLTETFLQQRDEKMKNKEKIRKLLEVFFMAIESPPFGKVALCDTREIVIDGVCVVKGNKKRGYIAGSSQLFQAFVSGTEL